MSNYKFLPQVFGGFGFIVTLYFLSWPVEELLIASMGYISGCLNSWIANK